MVKVSLAKNAALVVYDAKGKEKGESLEKLLLAALDDFGFTGHRIAAEGMDLNQFFDVDDYTPHAAQEKVAITEEHHELGNCCTINS